MVTWLQSPGGRNNSRYVCMQCTIRLTQKNVNAKGRLICYVGGNCYLLFMRWKLKYAH